MDGKIGRKHMSQIVYRIIFLLFVVAGAIRLSAQAPSSEVGFDQSRTSHDFDGGRYGVSLNHYWTENFSKAFHEKFTADTTLWLTEG
jgi:hypothetical protein